MTNAIVHGEGAVASTLWTGPVAFRVEVSDNGEATPEPRQDHQEDDATGRARHRR